MDTTHTVKIRYEGNQRLVPLPDDIQLNGEEVFVTQIGNSVVMTTRPRSWQEWWDNLPTVSEDFMLDRDQPTEFDKRESID